nr:hypothetical protein CFP56_03754 [Quercus suber]
MRCLTRLNALEGEGDIYLVLHLMGFRVSGAAWLWRRALLGIRPSFCLQPAARADRLETCVTSPVLYPNSSKPPNFFSVLPLHGVV